MFGAELRVCFVLLRFPVQFWGRQSAFGAPPAPPSPGRAPSAQAAEGMGRDTPSPAACPGQEPGLGPKEGIKYTSNICNCH